MSEDLRPSGDVTTQLIKNNKKIKAKIIANETCIIGGLNFAKEAFKYSNKKIAFQAKTKDGKKIKKGKVVAIINGKTKAILKSERVALNFLSLTSGVATKTRKFVDKVKKKQPKKVMMVTEYSMSDNVQVENPNVQFIKPCNLCPYMKKITLPKILDCLEKENNEIIIPDNLIKNARLSVERMTSIGR